MNDNSISKLSNNSKFHAHARRLARDVEVHCHRNIYWNFVTSWIMLWIQNLTTVPVPDWWSGGGCSATTQLLPQTQFFWFWIIHGGCDWSCCCERSSMTDAHRGQRRSLTDGLKGIFLTASTIILSFHAFVRLSSVKFNQLMSWTWILPGSDASISARSLLVSISFTAGISTSGIVHFQNKSLSMDLRCCSSTFACA